MPSIIKFANTIAYSPDGITWTASANGNSIFGATQYGVGIAWNGTIWVAVGGTTTNKIGYSSDGITWTVSASGNSIFTSGFVRGIAWNAAIPSVTINNSTLTLNRYGSGMTPLLGGANLDIVAPPYYNTGYTTFSASFTPN